MKPIFIVAVREHRKLGYILTPYLISFQNSQKFYTIMEPVTPVMAKYHPDDFDEKQTNIINLIDQYSETVLMKKFTKDVKKTQEFYSVISDEFIQKNIRPYIEEKIAKCIDLLAGCDIPLYVKNEKTTSIHFDDRITFVNEPAEIVFNFIKSDTGSKYYQTILYQNKTIKLLNRNGIILSTQPCILLLDNRIFCLNDIDAKKLTPFFVKEFIAIPKHTEKQYFETFVLSCIEKGFKVNTTGFEIVDTDVSSKAFLHLEKDWKNRVVLILKFKYGNYSFIANNPDERVVNLNTENDKFVFEKIVRDKKWESQKIKELKTLGLAVELNSIFFLDEKQTDDSVASWNLITWINNHFDELKNLEYEIVQDFFAKKYFLQNGKVELNIDTQKDWFDVLAQVSFGEFSFPFIKLKPFILNGQHEFPLPNNEIAIIPEEWFARFGSIFLWGIEKKGNLIINKFHFTAIAQIQNSQVEKQFEEFDVLVDVDSFKNISIPPEIRADLRPYQKVGFAWLNALAKMNFGGCLADDMGLGKTLQTITLLWSVLYDSSSPLKIDATKIIEPEKINQLDLFASVKKMRNTPTALIIMPTSLVHNWTNEIKKFAPSLKVCNFTGNDRSNCLKNLTSYDVILTSYGVVRNDIESLRNYYFSYIIVDESQFIKNPESKTYQTIMELNAMRRLTLTGTPIENSLTDLWAQMNFVNPGMLGSLNFFKEKFVTPIEKNNDELQAQKLKELISPFILRRTKDQVAKDLPSRIEQTVFCDMTESQNKFYDAEKSKLRNAILEMKDRNEGSKLNMIILQGLSKLRQIAIHPKLVDVGYEFESGKFDEVLMRIENVVAENHKVLIFSSFVKQLDLFAKIFDEQKWKYCLLTGSTQNREAVVNNFQKNDAIKLFLISIKAGGTGLNLTAADYVFILDPWWNPAVEMQAINRAHRIGQDKSVFVYRFISSETVEEKIQNLQQRKQSLADNFINTNNPFKQFSMDEILDLFN